LEPAYCKVFERFVWKEDGFGIKLSVVSDDEGGEGPETSRLGTPEI
jgi:hypothetical protein